MAGDVFGCCAWHTECRALGHCVREQQHSDDICSMRRWIGNAVQTGSVEQKVKPKEQVKAKPARPVQKRLF